MVELTKKYVIGTHVMFYEIEIYKEFIEGICNMLETIDNKQNVYIDLCLNMQENLEQIEDNKYNYIVDCFKDGILTLKKSGIINTNLKSYIKTKKDNIFFHTDYRRNLNYDYCKKVDYVIWGETDSLIPKEGLEAIDTLSQYTDSVEDYKYIMSFADRKMWDESWNPTVHPKYVNHRFIDNEEGHLNPNQAKSKMSIWDMNKINSEIQDFDFIQIPYTKIDGSFLVISSELIKSGVNIPLAMLYNDDEGLDISYNQLHRGNVKQYICKNLLKVHARRHPKKRMYIKNENNNFSFNDSKGNPFQVFKELSQANIQILHGKRGKFYEYNDLKEKI